jgi:hypothetical protein
MNCQKKDLTERMINNLWYHYFEADEDHAALQHT